jgi:hypothetical protein
VLRISMFATQAEKTYATGVFRCLCFCVRRLSMCQSLSNGGCGQVVEKTWDRGECLVIAYKNEILEFVLGRFRIVAVNARGPLVAHLHSPDCILMAMRWQM